MKKIIAGVMLLILLAGGALACAANATPGAQRAVTTTATATIYDSGKIAPPLPSGIPAPTITMVPPTTTKPSEGTSYSSDQNTSDRMIIRNGYFQLVVENVTATMEKITDLASAYDGFVVNSDVQQNQNRLYGNISVRVDSTRFDEALAAIRAMAVEVKSESTSGQDVTQEYTDLDSQLRNLEAAEAQLLELMKQAGDVADILSVQQELVKTRGQIEQIKGRMQYLEKSSALALIQVNLEQSTLTVEFTASARSVKEGENVRFSPTVAGGFTPYSFEWDFGDKRTSTDDSPVHAYKNSGSFTVSVKVTDDKGNTATLTRDSYINVLTGWQAGNTARSAWNAFVGFGHFLANVFIALGIFSPVWLAILVILYFTVWRRRKKA